MNFISFPFTNVWSPVGFIFSTIPFKMFNLFTLILFKILDYFGIIRRYDKIKQKTTQTKNDAIDKAIRIALLVLFLLGLVWLSVFLYLVFYYTFVPSIEHVKPAYLQFNECGPDDVKAVCSFPKGHVQLTRYNQFLMLGQLYKISVCLDVPESEPNKNLGMFMVCGQLVDKDGKNVAYSCKSTMLRYRSPLLHLVRLIVFGPLFITDLMEEKQTLNVELFPYFVEDQNHPITDMYIEIKTNLVEVYSSRVQIDAHLSGLRYFMFHWPLISASFGTLFNLMVIVFIGAMSWWKFHGPLSNEKYFENEKVLTLTDDAFEVEPENERKFILERKMSSSEA